MESIYVTKVMEFHAFVKSHAGNLTFDLFAEKEDAVRKKLTLEKIDLIKNELSKLETELILGKIGSQLQSNEDFMLS